MEEVLNKLIKFLSLSLVVILTIILCAACGLGDIIPGHVTQSSGSTSSSAPTEDSDSSLVVDVPDNEIPLNRTPALPMVLMPEASGVLTEENDKAIIDFSNTSDGYVMVKWLTDTTKQLRAQVTGPSGVTYTYIIQPDNEFSVLPLSDGNGTYDIKIFEQAEGDKYALALGTVVDVALVDEFAPFLRPNQFVNFNEESDIVSKAASLVYAEDTLLEKVQRIYEFVVNNFTYDTQFAEEVAAGGHKGYLPDLDAILARQYGICFDYAAVMTGMLRSQGIPTKLVEGFAGEVHHAWINVFSEDTGWIEEIIFFDGENWTLMDPTFASSAGASSALAQFIGDGTNYSTLFLH